MQPGNTFAQSENQRYMRRALKLARRGEGLVEPNPMVGCVIVRDDELIAEGWHTKYGQPHAEVEALRRAGKSARGADVYVTLEPCCHHGKTPPCTQALIDAKVARVFAAVQDPFDEVRGKGIDQLRAAGIEVSVGMCSDESEYLTAPYRKLVTTGMPWVIAKWAMTLDGRIATHTGDSKWISGEASRQIVHKVRGRVDAVIVGRETALRDDPLLTARPAGQRVATRVAMDAQAQLPVASRLVKSARDTPLIAVVGERAPPDRCAALATAGVEGLICPHDDRLDRLRWTLKELGRRRMTNVLVEGGGELLGSCFDLGQMDEVHVFVAPRLLGGRDAVAPICGVGIPNIASSVKVSDMTLRNVDDDIYISGRTTTPETA